MIKTLFARIIHKANTKHIIFHKGAYASRHATLEGYNSIGDYSYFQGVMGYGSYIANHSCLFATRIGRFCSIGSRVNMTISTHPMFFFSTSPSFYSSRPANGLSFVERDIYEDVRYLDKSEKIGIEIGNDVWIGDGVTILGPARIGDGAVIAAGALVNKDVPPYAVVGGVPAKIIKYRFDEETIDRLISLQWWNKDQDWLQSITDINVEEVLKYE